jgi:hypothetical protein
VLTRSGPPHPQRLVDVLHTHSALLQALLPVLQGLARSSCGPMPPPASTSAIRPASHSSEGLVVASTPVSNDHLHENKAGAHSPKSASMEALNEAKVTAHRPGRPSPTRSFSLGTPPLYPGTPPPLPSTLLAPVPSRDFCPPKVAGGLAPAPDEDSSSGGRAPWSSDPGATDRPPSDVSEGYSRKRRRLLDGSIATPAVQDEPKLMKAGGGTPVEEEECEDEERASGSLGSLGLGSLF